MSLVNTLHHTNYSVNGISSYSTKQGNLNIIFEITGASNELIDVKSIRLNSVLEYLKQDGTKLNNLGFLDFKTAGTGNRVNGNGLQVNTNNRIGCAGCISSIILEDGNNNVLESVYGYGHLLNKVIQLTMSQDDLGTWAGAIFGIKAFGKAVQNLTAMNNEYELSQKLYTGVLQSKPIPFSLIGNKLKITITLSPSAQILGGVGLTDTQHPTANNVISIMSSFIPSDHLNNYLYDSYQSTKLQNTQIDPALARLPDVVEIKESTTMKNSARFPSTFPIDERLVVNQGNLDVQRVYNYIQGIDQFSSIDNCLISSSTENYGAFYEPHAVDFDVSVYGVGVRFDALQTSMGQNFSQANYILRLNSGLNGTRNNEMITSVFSTRRLVMGAGAPVVIA
jgi:hypothetical protein